MLDILRLIYDYGWAGLVIAGAVVVLYKITMRKVAQLDKTINKDDTSIFDSDEDSSEEDAIDDEDESVVVDLKRTLKMHPFFNMVAYRLNTEIFNLHLDSRPVRQQLYKDLLYIRIKSIYDAAMAFSEQDMSEWTPQTWVFEATNAFNQSMSVFQAEAMRGGIPPSVVTLVVIWSMKQSNYVLNAILQIGNMDSTKDPYSKTMVFLSILDMLVATTIGDAEKEFKLFNGSITGAKYGNGVVEP